MFKLVQKANVILHELKTELPNLVTKDEKMALLNETEKLIGHNGLGLFADLVIEQLKAKVSEGTI